MALDGAPNYLPTHFANPFRSLGGSRYVPLTTLRTAGGPELIESTFLRRTTSTSDEPLFSFISRYEPFDDVNGNGSYDAGETYNDLNLNGTYDPPYDDTTLAASTNPIRGHFNNSDSNPYFRYQMYQKTGNVLTNRSNVYAVWVTVGFFEVTRHDVDEGHPDGYQLQGELRDNYFRRHKAFFLIDRSIPVAFSRGENFNVHKAILTSRIVD